MFLRRKHPDKDIEAAIIEIESMGWQVKMSKGHSFAIAKCPYNDGNCRDGKYCRFSIWSTPRNPGNHVRNILKNVKKCVRNDNG